MASLNGGIPARGDKGDRLQDDQKTKDVRSSNILAAKVSVVVEVIGGLLKKSCGSGKKRTNGRDILYFSLCLVIVVVYVCTCCVYRSKSSL